MIKTAEILCVGTELLLGEVINTNAAHISKKLAEFGVSVFHHAVVGDNPERLKAALDLALSRSDLVVMSGGLGPTIDDLTKETVAAKFGLSMHTDEATLENIEKFFASRGKGICTMTKNNLKQADIPTAQLRLPTQTAPPPAFFLRRTARLS